MGYNYFIHTPELYKCTAMQHRNTYLKLLANSVSDLAIRKSLIHRLAILNTQCQLLHLIRYIPKSLASYWERH